MAFKFYIKKNTWLTHGRNGWGNGYVDIPENHWLYGLDYDYVTGLLSNNGFSVHGGLTYAEESDIKGNWRFGFDTAHSFDTQENAPKSYVYKHTKALATALFALKEPEKQESELNDFEHCEGCSKTQVNCRC